MKLRDKTKPVITDTEITEVLTQKQQDLVKETENNILCERTFRSLENLYNSVDSEYRAVSFSPILKSPMIQAYEIIEENKKK